MNLVEAERLVFVGAGAPLADGLSFGIPPGLTIVRGGEGRGKTTLLRLLAGAAEPAAGVLRRCAGPTWFANPADAAHHGVVAHDWLEALRPRFPQWDGAALPALLEGFGLTEHIGKPMFMLSAGSRRKVGLVGAAVCGATLTLLDGPFAALDAASCGRLTRLLDRAATSTDRAWVVADYDVPAGLAGAPPRVIELGD